MAEGGNLPIHALIEDEDEYDGPFEEWKFEGEEAGKLGHFCERNLMEIANNLSCQISRIPKDGLAKTLSIKCRKKLKKKVEKSIKAMNEVINSLDSKKFTFSRDNSRKLSDYLSSSERLKGPICYIPDIANNCVEIVGKSYEEVSKAEHQLKVYLGEIKTTGRRRLGRQISDSANSTVLSSSANFSKSFDDVVSSSSFGGDYKDTKSKNRVKGFAQTFSGAMFSRNNVSLPSDFHFEIKLKNKFVLKVNNTSIINLEVDVIVNAANNNMMHGGGVAKVISRAAGWRLDRESQDYVLNHGNVAVGENIITTAGNLTQYKAVIHAVGPIWHEYRNKTDCLDALSECVYNILETCRQNSYGTVAMPAISAGIYAVPKQLCADMYVEAAARFSKNLKQGECPRELHIVDIDTSILKFVEASAKKWEKEPQSVNPRVTLPKFLETNPHLAGSSSSNKVDDVRGHRVHSHGGGETRSNLDGDLLDERDRSRSQRHTGDTPKDKATSQNKHDLKNPLKKKGEEQFRWGGKAQVYDFGGKITVKIFKGDITKAKNMDAIVSCIDKYFINVSLVAMAIEKAGGPEYKKKFERMRIKYRTFANYGSILKCKGGTLGVHHVMHVVMNKILDVSYEEMKYYSGHICMVLNKADMWNYQKLVIPMFGTGLVQTRPEKMKACCVAMLKGIDDYLMESLGKGKVTEIHLVNNDEWVCKTLVDVYNEGVNTTCEYGKSYSEPGRGDLNKGTERGGMSMSQYNSVAYQHTRQDRKESHEFKEPYDRHLGRNQFENDARGRQSEGKHLENSSASVRCQRGASSNVYRADFSECESEDEPDYELYDTDETRKPNPPKSEPKPTGNLKIIEN